MFLYPPPAKGFPDRPDFRDFHQDQHLAHRCNLGHALCRYLPPLENSYLGAPSYHTRGPAGDIPGMACTFGTAKLKSPAVWACLGVYPLDMPRTPYRASEGKRSQ